MKKIAFVLVSLLACVLAVYFGLTHKTAFFSLLDKATLLQPKKLRELVSKKGERSKDTREAEIQKQQEDIARSIAEQQLLSQQIQRSAMQSVSDVQRTLKSIEDINRVNRQNQQFHQPK